jgi:thiosulfate dehydrogenase [quinone] large subunit
MKTKKEEEMAETITIEEPKITRFLFNTQQGAWIWLVARLYLGYEWLHAGWGKITGTEGGTFAWHFGFTKDSWFRSSAGLKGFAGYALTNTKGPNAAVNYGWYARFLHYIATGGGWMAPFIAVGETVIGIALIVGLFTAVAAFFGGMLNVSFGLAGVAGVNPVFFVIEVFLILAWRNAGYYGLDRYVLPAVGTPWHKGKLFEPPVPVVPTVSVVPV